ncbi:MAG TPA: FlgO family outer membrane protein [Dissulfurispiraceae bacterium]|nr:FlgO family outer membrane protein [Dissulfurispiraceae bacterium]
MRKMLAVLIMGFLVAAGAVSAQEEQPAQKPKPIFNMLLKPQGSVTPTGNLNALVIFLADQLGRNVDKKPQFQPIVITTFVNLDNLRETSRLGRLLSENLMHEMHVRKWSIVDFRLVSNLLITESGEFSLARDIKKIKETYRVGGIVTGTYLITNDTVMVNARFMDTDTGMVLSTGQVAIPTEGNELLLYNAPQRGMSIKGASELPAGDDIRKWIDDDIRKRVQEEMKRTHDDLKMRLTTEMSLLVEDEVEKSKQSAKASPKAGAKKKIPEK